MLVLLPYLLYKCYAAAAAKSLQPCPTLCKPVDGSPPGSPVPGILQARTLEWAVLLQCMKVKSESEVAQSCPTLSNPKDCSPPGSSVHGTFQARVLEWAAIAFSSSVATPIYIPTNGLRRFPFLHILTNTCDKVWNFNFFLKNIYWFGCTRS